MQKSHLVFPWLSWFLETLELPGFCCFTVNLSAFSPHVLAFFHCSLQVGAPKGGGFDRGVSFLTKNAPKFPLKFLSLDLAGSKNPAKSPPNSHK